MLHKLARRSLNRIRPRIWSSRLRSSYLLSVLFVILALVGLACSSSLNLPTKASQSDDFDVIASESQTAVIPPNGVIVLTFATPEIAFDSVIVSTKSAGDVNFSIASLSEAPQDIALSEESVTVFQYLRVDHDNLDDSDIFSATIAFDVPKEWLKAGGYDADSVVLQRHADNWTALPTTIVGSAASNFSYKAASPGLSLFAITATKTDEPPIAAIDATRTAVVIAVVATPEFQFTQTPSPTITPSTSSQPEPLSTPTATATHSPTPSAIPLAKPSTVTPIPTPTKSPTATPTALPTSTSTSTAIPTPTSTPIPTNTATPTAMPAPTNTATPTPTAPPPAPTSTATATPQPGDERYGVVLHTFGKSSSQYFLDQLGVDWYLNFDSDTSQIPSGANKVLFMQVPTDPTVWTSGQAETIESLTDEEIATLGFPTRPEIRQMAMAAPGSYWYIFGEPNRYGFIDPIRFTPVFHYYVTQLKFADPTAKIIGTSILNWDWTCFALCTYQKGGVWLESFIGEYESEFGEKPEVDIWAIDTYPIDWTNTPNSASHVSIATDQLVSMREFLDGIPEYQDTPIWITEIAVHVGYDGWTQLDGSLFPTGAYHWDKMSDYITGVLDWLEANAESNNIEKWFFFTSWRDIINVGADGYMGITFFNDSAIGSPLNCLGEVYRARALGEPRLKCNAAGEAVPD